MDYKFNRGSEWRKWDLHIHSNASEGKGTPEEIVNAAIAKDLSVIAITDHHSVGNLDEIKRIGKEKGLTVISGIEFRTEYGSKSVHLIGLFPDSHDSLLLNAEALHDRILAKLNLSKSEIISLGKQKDASLNEEQAFKKGMFLCQVDFKKVAKLIREHGGIVSVHAGTKANSFDEEIKHQGKGAKNVNELYDSLGTLKEELLKTHIDICEIRKENDSETFYQEKFNLPSIIASDAHNIEDVGSKFVWIKADPTFDGLKQILIEKDRIFIGDYPPIFNKVRDNRTKYIKTIEIRPASNYNQSLGKWFDCKIDLNKELVAIIGNKGSGKSAIADIIALCSNFNNHDDFSFLKKGKFRDGKLAQQFEANLIFESENEYSKNLNNSNIADSNCLVKYLPQGYFEKLCNEISKVEQFKKEIQSVVFQYIDESERYGLNDFDELIRSRSKIVENDIALLKIQLNEFNQKIINYEKKANITYKEDIDNKLKLKKSEIEALCKSSA